MGQCLRRGSHSLPKSLCITLETYCLTVDRQRGQVLVPRIASSRRRINDCNVNEQNSARNLVNFRLRATVSLSVDKVLRKLKRASNIFTTIRPLVSISQKLSFLRTIENYHSFSVAFLGIPSRANACSSSPTLIARDFRTKTISARYIGSFDVCLLKVG